MVERKDERRADLQVDKTVVKMAEKMVSLSAAMKAVKWVALKAGVTGEL